MRAGPGDNLGEVGVAPAGAELSEVDLEGPGALVLLCGQEGDRERGLGMGLTDILKCKMHWKGVDVCWPLHPPSPARASTGSRLPRGPLSPTGCPQPSLLPCPFFAGAAQDHREKAAPGLM